MKKTHLSKAITFFSLVLLVSIAHAQANDATTPTEQEHSISKVRIVRLSQVKGSVQIARSSDRSARKTPGKWPSDGRDATRRRNRARSVRSVL